MTPGLNFPHLLHFAHRFTVSTGRRLERVFIRALVGRQVSVESLRGPVGDATRELRAAGLADQAVLDVLGELVEDTGRACGADRLSLISGEMRWMPLRAKVLGLASVTLRPDVYVATAVV